MFLVYPLGKAEGGKERGGKRAGPKAVINQGKEVAEPKNRNRTFCFHPTFFCLEMHTDHEYHERVGRKGTDGLSRLGRETEGGDGDEKKMEEVLLLNSSEVAVGEVGKEDRMGD